jgi:hypothetical protein
MVTCTQHKFQHLLKVGTTLRCSSVKPMDHLRLLLEDTNNFTQDTLLKYGCMMTCAQREFQH